MLLHTTCLYSRGQCKPRDTPRLELLPPQGRALAAEVAALRSKAQRAEALEAEREAERGELAETQRALVEALAALEAAGKRAQVYNTAVGLHSRQQSDTGFC